MTVSTKWAGRVKEIIEDARQARADSAEVASRQAFAHFDYNQLAIGPVVDQTPRARLARGINRIATWYGWHGEVARELDAAQCTTLLALPDEALERLAARMALLEECVQNGGDAPDAPPAR